MNRSSRGKESLPNIAENVTERTAYGKENGRRSGETATRHPLVFALYLYRHGTKLRSAPAPRANDPTLVTRRAFKPRCSGMEFTVENVCGFLIRSRLMMPEEMKN